jgi:hypothetical protein
LIDAVDSKKMSFVEGIVESDGTKSVERRNRNDVVVVELGCCCCVGNGESE